MRAGRRAPRLLCVTRAYPPTVGGMERLSSDFTNALAARLPTRLVANRHGKAALPWFLPWAAFQLRRLASQCDVIHLGDLALISLLAALPRGRPPVLVTAHGLDVRYPKPFYQSLLRRFLPQVDLVLCISRFVEREVRARFPGLRATVLTPATDPDRFVGEGTKQDLAHALGRPLAAGPLLLAVARLVPRKGLAWFVEKVLPELPGAALLLLGEGPERAAIAKAAARAGTAPRVIFGGIASLQVLRVAYHAADLFVMPNIPVPGDAEGFGLVALEAASAGLPVIASNLEGIPDAVVSGRTGVLVPPLDARAWTAAVSRLLENRAEREALRREGPRVIRDSFAWEDRATETIRLFSSLLPPVVPEPHPVARTRVTA